MLIEETFNISAPVNKLYEFFLNAPKVGHCIPGCENVEMVGDNEYDSIIKAKVGVVSTKFKVRTIIEETVSPTLIRTTGQGKELRNLGHFKQKTKIMLKELSENETEVSYQAEVSIVGRLATFGDRIMKSKAKAMGKEFANAVKDQFKEKDLSTSNTPEENTISKQEKGIWQRVIQFITDKITRIYKSIFQQG